ncbi:MAG: hypothetical protein HGB11_10255 [Chlorobiales bacterium]|nr:hypothetical protein [Chlorobiales bacterium]
MRASSNQFQLPVQSEIEYFQSKLLKWYRANGRDFPWRKKSIPIYQKVIAEVLLQRSRAETIAAFYPAFIARFPSWASLASTTEEEIAEILKPIGLWRRRSSTLLKLATEMKRNNGKFPRTREEIEALPGVGQYIANAVMMFAHGEPQALLDVNMARVLERYFRPRKLADIRYDPYLQHLAKFVINCEAYVSLNWAILDLASMICKARTMEHEKCCLRHRCRHFMTMNRELP